VAALGAALLIGWSVELARGPDPAAAVSRLSLAASFQAGVLAQMAPLLALWSACGILAGLTLRDGVPRRRGYSSPAGAWIAKRAIAGAAVAAGAFALGALRVDPGWMYAAGALHAAGWAAYLRNLPARL